MGACGNKESGIDLPKENVLPLARIELKRSRSLHKPMSKRRFKLESKLDSVRPAQFILENDSNIMEIYDLERTSIGAGTFGTVRRGTHRMTNVVRAVKTIPKAKVMNIPIFKHEVAIMKL